MCLTVLLYPIRREGDTKTVCSVLRYCTTLFRYAVHYLFARMYRMTMTVVEYVEYVVSTVSCNRHGRWTLAMASTVL
jgi:hypothetical protein